MLDGRTKVVILAGPPCAGKTTYARANSIAGDDVLDWDVLVTQVTGLPMYAWLDDLQSLTVARVFRNRLRLLRQGFVIRTAPQAEYRAILRAGKSAMSIVLATPAEICLARLAASDRLPEAKERQAKAIRDWWRTYRPSRDRMERVIAPAVAA